MSDIALAYRRCEAITRREARNFFYGIRLLPEPKRAAMSALYAFARRVDDIGDGAGTTGEKQEALARVRDEIVQVASGHPPCDDAVLVALADAVAHFPIPVDALGEIVTGCEMDCRRERYATFEELTAYCRCVAGSVGRLSLGVFGSADAATAPELADRLGIALQLTNILRDIVEDRDEMGRVYLPVGGPRRFRLRATTRPARRTRSSDCCGSRPDGRGCTTRRVSRCSTCSTGVRAPVSRRWRGSTTACSTASRRTRSRRSTIA